MGRAPCCAKVGLNRGRWTAEEDDLLIKYIEAHGEGCWRALPQKAGLLRCGKSCRLRWINYLRADVKRGNISAEEEELIIKLHSLLGNRWSFIAGRMPGRTDNEIKNYWNTHLSRKLAGRGVDPLTHEPIAELTSRSASKPSTIFTSNNGKQRQMKSQKQGIISETQEEETAKARASEKLRVKKKPKHKTMKRNFNLAARNESRSVSQQKTPGELQVLVQPLHSPPISVNSSRVNRPSCESSCSELDSSPLVTMTSFSDEIQFFLRNSSEDRTATTLEASGEEIFKETHTEDVKIEQDEQYPCTDTALPVSSKFTDSPWDYSSSSHPLLLDMNLFGSDELFECLLPSNAERSRQLSAATETTTPQEDPDYLWPCFLSNVEAPYPTSLSSNIRRS